MKKIILLAFAAAVGFKAEAQSYVPISISGFTADIIANGTGPAANSVTQDVDGVDYNFVAQNFVNGSGQSPTTFLPANGLVSSLATPGVNYQLAPYSGNNSLRITTTPGTGTLTFATPRTADQLYLLVTSAYGCTFTGTVNFTDGTNQAIASTTLPNWFDGTTNVAVQGISRVQRVTDAIENSTTNPRMYQVVVTINATNITKNIQSISFSKTATPSNSILHVFAVSARTVLTNDVSVTAIAGLASGCGLTNQENVCVTVKNNGSSPQSNFPVSYTLNTGTPVTETFAGPLAPGASANYCFTTKVNLATPGNYTLQACTGLANDEATSNNCTSKAITSIPTVATFPYSQGFETNDGGWTAGGTNSSWALGTPAKNIINSAGSGTKSWVTSLTGNYNTSENSQVTSPCFNLSTLVKPVITLKIWWQTEAGWDGAVLQSSIDGGTTWQNVGAFGDPNNWYNDNSLDGRVGGQSVGWGGRISTNNGSAGWRTAKHELTGLGGKPAVRFRIAFGSDGTAVDNGFAFDDINIFETPQNETALTAITTIASGCALSNAQTISATIKNLGLATLTTIPVTYKINNGTPVTENWTGSLATGGTATFSFATKANLSTPGEYTIQVCTALAGDPDASNDCSSIVVNSLPTISTYPYNQDFEGTAYTGWLAGGTSSSWALGTPAKTVINSAGSGTKSWVTSLTGTYNVNEKSQVVSPCFDFSSLQKPLMEMKVWWSNQTSFDGAVLQSSIDNGQTWVNVGAFGSGINWYNDNTINGAPGGQPAATAEGWSGTGTASSNGWVIAKHALTGLQLKPNVRLRIAFGADASTQNDGFAFDDVKIYDTPNNEVGVIGITNIASGCGLSNTQPITVTIRNFGLATQTSIPVSYTLDGVNFINETITGVSVAPNTTYTYTFNTKADLSVAGVYNITACTKLTGDGDATNDCKAISVRSIPTITSYPYFQDFETNDGGWVASGTNSSWALGTPAKLVIKGAASGTKAFVTNLTGTYNNTENSVVLGPCFNFSSLTNPQIDLKVWWHSEFSMDGAVLQASTDNGVTWNNVGFNQDPNNWFNDGTINGAPGGQAAATAEGWTGHQVATSSNGWVRARHALSGLGGQGNVKLRIAFGSNASTVYDGFAFDDILIYEKPTNDAAVTAIIPMNSGCGITNQETVKILVENAGTNNLPGVPVNFKVDNGSYLATAETTPAIPAGQSITYTFTAKANLSAAGDHTITATTQLAGDQVPQNDAVVTTQTSIPTIATYPYTQNFENGDGGWKASGTFSTWALGKPAKTAINSAASGNNSWVTGLTGTYNINENSRVLGPCFNFTNIVDPVFQMKAWWHAQSSYDGAVLQSSIDNGATWQNVGAKGDANSTNWFNDNTINAGPGGQPVATAQGWTGTTTTAPATSSGWVTVRHALTGLAGQSNVQLRIAFAADASTQNDGFAFDDILIEDVANNIAVTAFKPLVKICGFSNNEPVEVTLTNLSNTAIASGISLQYTVTLNGNLIFTSPVEPYNSALAANTSVQFTFPAGANLSLPGTYAIQVTATRAGDPDATNNSFTYNVANSLFTSMPQGFSFEPGQKGLTDLRSVKAVKSNITESTAASSPLAQGSTKGIVMDAVTGSAWTLPILTVDPWTNNLDNKSGVYMCLPAQTALDSLWLIFDLKQTYKDANANTNFRVTVNGTMVGSTYRPPLDGTPDVWKTVKVNLTSYKNQAIQVGLESSTKEAYNNGAGTANLVDNVIVRGRFVTGTKDDMLQGQLSVFPNPSNGQFNVSLPEGKAYELEVVDLTGRTLKKQSVKGGSSMLDMQGASQGIYLLKVKGQNATAIRKLIIE